MTDPTYPTRADATAAAVETLRASGLNPDDFHLFQLVQDAFYNRTPVLADPTFCGYGARDVYAYRLAAAGARKVRDLLTPIPTPVVWPPAVPSDRILTGSAA